jgi:hypothetical protein
MSYVRTAERRTPRASISRKRVHPPHAAGGAFIGRACASALGCGVIGPGGSPPAIRGPANRGPGTNEPCDFALVAMLGLLGLRIFEAIGADITDVGEQHGHRALCVCGEGTMGALIWVP